MPNWCENTVTITAKTPEELAKFMSHVKSKDGLRPFSFQSIRPMPRELEGTRSPAQIVSEEEYNSHEASKFEPRPITQKMSDLYKAHYGADNWYDWTNRFWGTKWEVDTVDCMIRNNNTEISYYFDTAWSPPVKICETLFDEFPNLEIEWYYEEPSMEMYGYL